MLRSLNKYVQIQLLYCLAGIKERPLHIVLSLESNREVVIITAKT